MVIDGDIEPGCQVSAETIDVQNVFQADVRVRSGIRVHGHIEDTDISSSQGAEVKSVINSSIRAGDTIRVHEKIFQSDIFTNAACLALDAVIESSNIMACQCIDAHTIISSEKIPCTLTFGLICPDDQDHKLRTDYLKMEAQKKQLQDKLANAEQAIKDTLQLKNKIRSIKPSIKQKIINLKKIRIIKH
ncbi:MAG: hypothetical protein OMM_07332 [Candidatus Magnetoglobus multicellularis str. Araruama]|uniref:Uncharacterized protein n=1 Tax=Candidatus Magnetoglobus multicellularis str. Araruama TaxID=890399 RepID=A0A1V1PD17_9BACT|nr:MAG: hypothetical protein OMM_07332 [Candidatus Magnetoglobus multicellularis str. Araruama]